MRVVYFFLLMVTINLSGQESSNPPNNLVFIDVAAFDELTLKEWKKFKYFENQLESSESSEEVKGNHLKKYSRDSLNILAVKLIAVKVLDNKELLELDISENAGYYEDLLNQLRESSIDPKNYLFLEIRLNLYLNEILEKKVQQSKWLISGLVLLVLILGFIVFKKWRIGISARPQLSNQEKTIQSLILQGKSNKEIASELFISMSTVKTHITNLYSKLKVANRQELFQNSTGTST
ncbi:response regulator transcription factor [Croceitalea rosinachiae]|uniref:LuxR C-terminal-related transcriptional regulator n=1 Tax=Croceitalea rosinachiae TaxID=3075596 RepID=A0ABU3A7I9_9FLAO|nr:LuxR C-terminal-related transcriptional regulator [Croceitalea sp. F388]MDT0605537.1 LuxR C-terminal-related transcriptional regulator [Croceitalea sp. F388]